MQLNYLKIVSILMLSSLLGLIVNNMSSRSIPLIREKQELAWGNDSLINIMVEGAPARELNREDVTSAAENNSEKEPETVKETTAKEPVKINLETAYSLYSRDILFIDARPPDEFNEGHIKGARSIPYYADNVEELINNIRKEEPVVVYCSGTDCDLSIMLGNKMFKMGYNKIFVFFGGWEDWSGSGYPVELNEETAE